MAETLEQKRQRDKEKQYWMKSRHGITPIQWQQLFDEQEGLCYLCEEPLPESRSDIHIDHSHDCCRGSKSCGNCIRGLACRLCNQGIGQFGDSPERLRKVADNLEKRIVQLATR